MMWTSEGLLEALFPKVSMFTTIFPANSSKRVYSGQRLPTFIWPNVHLVDDPLVKISLNNFKSLSWAHTFLSLVCLCHKLSQIVSFEIWSISNMWEVGKWPDSGDPCKCTTFILLLLLRSAFYDSWKCCCCTRLYNMLEIASRSKEWYDSRMDLQRSIKWSGQTVRGSAEYWRAVQEDREE